MAERRRFSISAGMLGSVGAEQVVERDMDMKRAGPQESAVSSRFFELMRWLAPQACDRLTDALGGARNRRIMAVAQSLDCDRAVFSRVNNSRKGTTQRQRGARVASRDT